MFKVSVFRGETERGAAAIPLFGPADPAFEKTAAPTLLSEVSQYIQTLRPSPSAIYVLVNAMGAGEFYGSNINGDYFSEASLIHAPDDWTGKPILDIAKAKEWPYGFPTFYDALPYAHHRNKEPSRAYGAVELAAWNQKMRRVELVVRVDKDKCERFAGTGIWDKLKQGQFPDVSMGCKVPFDTCSICLDWETYRRAQSTFDPKRHKSPGDAVLVYHKELLRKGKGIRGLSPTRKEYCEHTAKQMNRILPDGRKVFVYNDYPRFFDISFVFIGADKTAKVMLKLAEGARVWSLPSAELAEKLGYDEVLEHLPSVAPMLEKAASAPEEILKSAFIGKAAKDKESEIVKDVLPSQFANKAVPLLTKTESDLPNDLLDALGASGVGPALSTSGGLGIVLRPREFQRVILIATGNRSTADHLDDAGAVFSKSDKEENVPLDPSFFRPSLAQLLLPLLAARSALGPAVERRILVVSHHNGKEKKSAASLSSNVLDKIGAAYNGYRSGLMELVASAQELVGSAAKPSDLHLLKLASAPAAEVFTPLSFAYLKHAFLDELEDGRGRAKTAQATSVERGLPSRNTWTTANLVSGEQKS